MKEGQIILTGNTIEHSQTAGIDLHDNVINPDPAIAGNDLVPSQISISGIQRVLQSLLNERISIRDLPTILEGIAEIAVGGRSSQTIVEHVRALISAGEVKPGDRLPPERELARKLKISRSSLRAGIGFLSAMGVLKSRHGAGTFVSSGPPALDSSSLSVLGALHGFLPWQMFEARIVLEANVAALAAERATDEHVAELAEEVAEMYASLTDPQEYLIHDVRFHRTIARAAGNPILLRPASQTPQAARLRRDDGVSFSSSLDHV